ncbi:MAG: cobyrinate a,c-diamide synthase, partial [Chloroflexota bacterium]
MSTPRLIFAAPESGSGKTLITAGLCHAFREKGLTVQPFKTGPDYIDPSYHALAAGRPCRNLDAWMLPREAVVESFVRNSADADVAIIEGVMGLFDGFGVEDDEGSTADIAQLLDGPVVLILPVRGAARSAAATVLGFNLFSRYVQLAGVILNKVGSEHHAEMCRTAIEKETGVPVLGYVPRDDRFVLPERHLGLVPTVEDGGLRETIELIGSQVAETVDVDRLWEIALDQSGHIQFTAEAQRSQRAEQVRLNPNRFGQSQGDPLVRIGVAADEAFSFTYPENVELLREAGAEIVEFSPMRDGALPEKLDGLILSGGFPEMYAVELSGNLGMHESIRQAAAVGLPIYAECGGLMYLTEAISSAAGQKWRMVGVLLGESGMTERVTLGYRLVEAAVDGPILKKGERVRGHEFHYSKWEV